MPKGKPKTFSTPKKKQKIQNKPPETADEYLAAGIDLEEAGEKWRGGDAAKASRFFVRAIEMYDEGLSLFPSSFDMHYNKARVQYDITQRPALLAQASAPIRLLLEQALQSHRWAADLDRDNADVVFNTGQVLASLADAIEDDDLLSMQHLEEALRLFQECLMKQEALLAQSESLASGASAQADPSDDIEDDGGVLLGDASHVSDDNSDSEANMRWASVVEPTTPSSLAETCVAALDTLAALFSTISQEQSETMSTLNELAESWMHKLNKHIQTVEDPKLQDEARCSILKCRSAAAEAIFQFGGCDVATYSQRVKDIMEVLRQSLAETSNFLSSCADVNIAFAVATADVPSAATLRWTKLAKALEYLEQASKNPDVQVSDLARIHTGRGDIELFRFSLCLEGELPSNISNQSIQTRLLKNAEIYYKGAAAIAKSNSTAQGEPYTAAIIRMTLCVCLGSSSNNALTGLRAEGLADAEIAKALEELVDESLISRSILQERDIF